MDFKQKIDKEFGLLAATYKDLTKPTQCSDTKSAPYPAIEAAYRIFVIAEKEGIEAYKYLLEVLDEKNSKYEEDIRNLILNGISRKARLFGLIDSARQKT